MAAGTNLVTLPSNPPAVRTIDAQTLIAQAIDKGTDPSALERLVALGERMLTIQAKQEWTAAMTAAQADFPVIAKTKDGKIGGGTYSYAPLDEIDAAVKPVLHRHGLVMTWGYDSSRPGEVGASCRILHSLGHMEESGYFYVPIEPREVGPDGKAKGASPAQRAGIAATYARRYSCCAITGIVPQGDDSDGADDDSGQDDRPSTVKRDDGSLLVTEVQEVKGGKPGQRAWTRYDVHFDDGSRAATFDRATGELAKQAKADGVLVMATVQSTAKGVDLVSLTHVEAPGPVKDALDMFSAEVTGRGEPGTTGSGTGDVPTPTERALLNSLVVALADKLKLKGDERAKLWRDFCGDKGPEDVAIEYLTDLVGTLRKRAGQA